MKKSFTKRLLSGVTSALLAVSSVLPSSLGTFAASNEKGDERDDVTLLVGENPKKPDGTPYQQTFASVDAAIAQYNKDYALGIASQFCVFLKGDFTPTGSDAEGRVAVGGNIKTSGEYELGNGDFTTASYLGYLIDNEGAASLIVSGETVQGIMGKAWNDYANNEDGSDKIRPVQLIWKNKDTTIDRTTGIRYEEYYINPDNVYSSTDLNVVDWFEKVIEPRSETLSKKKSDTTIKIDPDLPLTVPYFNQWINGDENSGVFNCPTGNFETKTLGGVTDFTYNGSQNVGTVYFNVDEEQWDSICKTQVFRFNNIPDGAYIVVNVAGEEIIINDVDEHDYTYDRFTYINGVSISQGIYTVFDPDGEIVPNEEVIEKLKGEGIYGLKGHTGEKERNEAIAKLLTEKFGEGYTITGMYNNCKDVDRLLYNFYEAELIRYAHASQGTILAPKAHVDSTGKGLAHGNGGWGHLSGALIAKSAEGCMEYGYRPYGGPASVIDISSNYYINLLKVDGEGEPLDGAILGIYEIDAEGNPVGEPVAQIEKTTNGKAELDVPAGKTYAVKEITAPEGYKVDNTQIYYIEVTETEVDENGVNIGTGDYEYSAIKVDAADLTDEEKADIDKYVPTTDTQYTYTYTYTFEPVAEVWQMAWQTDSASNLNFNIKYMEITREDGTTIDSMMNGGISPSFGTSEPTWAQINGITREQYGRVKSIKFVLTGPLQDSVILTAQGNGWNNITTPYSRDDGTTEEVAPNSYYKVVPDDTTLTFEYIGSTTFNGENYRIELEQGDEIKLNVNCIKKVGFKSSTESDATYEEFKNATATIYEPLNVNKNFENESVKYVLGDDEYSFKVNEAGEITEIKKNGESLDPASEEFEQFKAYAVDDVDDGYIIAKVDGNNRQVLDAKVILNDESNAFEFVNKKQETDVVRFSKEDVKGLAVSGAKLKLTGILAGTDGKEAAVFTEDQFGFVARTATDNKDDEITSDEESKEEEKPATSENPVISITEDGKTVTWTSDDKILEIKNLKDGTYTLEETKAPDGYHEAEPIKFVMQGGTLVSIDGVKLGENADKVIHMIDVLHGSINISKRDGNLQGLAGAKLQLTGVTPDGKEKIEFDKDTLAFNIAEGGENMGDGIDDDGDPTTLIWFSSGYSVTLSHLPVGTYTLEELEVPKGYTGIEEPIKFTVAEVDGKAQVTFENIESLESSSKYDYGTQTSFFSENSSTIYVINTSIVKIQKVERVDDTTTQPLAGAKLKLSGVKLDENGEETKDKITFRTTQFPDIEDDTKDDLTEIIWDSTGKDYIRFLNMQDGRYTLEEVEAPDGYQLAASRRFTVKGGLIVRIDGNPVTDVGSVDLITMTDRKTSITVAKRDESGKGLAGAKLSLSGVKDDKTINLQGVKISVTGLRTEDSSDEKIIWMSSGTDQIRFEGLPDGTYTLREEEAPEGYQKADDITFTIENGSVTEYSSKPGPFTLTDKKVSITVSKKAESEEGSFLPGAELSLTGTKTVGEESVAIDLSNVTVTGAKSYEATATGITWITAEDTVKFAGLPNGSYTLSEVSAPDGYEKAAPIKFTIKDGEVSNNGAFTLVDKKEVVESTTTTTSTQTETTTTSTQTETTTTSTQTETTTTSTQTETTTTSTQTETTTTQSTKETTTPPTTNEHRTNENET
ncbi:MAG: choice-of-anchor A family protein, partial [Oscillospiraceae bacterium]|nr:choice-of-anchor A family protein [Oscillospiraceae bacterium]